MKPEARSQTAFSITQSKAKMYEYNVPLEEHITLRGNPAQLFPLTIGILGDLSARINDGNATYEEIQDLRNNLPFSARFFDAYIEAQLSQADEMYVRLLGSAAYYLCDLPGSSNILAERMNNQTLNLGIFGLENLLTWLLLTRYFPTALTELPEGSYQNVLIRIYDEYLKFNSSGDLAGNVIDSANQLRAIAYSVGDPKELLLADLIGAVIRKRIENSTWICLSKYTDLPILDWANIIKKDTFIKEFWPAQHLLGKKGVFRGKSAVVQMPTSAGKTKATEIIIRSAFLAKRISLAVIIAPFRALCHEIRQDLLQAFQGDAIYVDELSDVVQNDYSIERILRDQVVLVATPEKFNYVLRHSPEIAEKIRLIIYDEAHQFDNGNRGITYELLLTSLKARISAEAQTVLISAVISNASQIGAWLAGNDMEVVEGAELIPSFKSTGFTTIADPGRNLYFVDRGNIDKREYYVPRIFHEYKLKHGMLFPHLNNGRELTLFLGVRLAIQGSIAIFSGTKDTVSSMCETIVKAFRNGLPLAKPSENLKSVVELQKLKHLHDINLGEKSIFSQAADLGVLAHHNNIPHGLRLSIEYAMKKADINFVICTSTLAQGVNLPIRYLIVTSVYQGKEKISVRDFQNLIGRSGRSGMHTEGSILFADPMIYDEKQHWGRVKRLLKASESESCTSQILALIRPLYSDNKEFQLEIKPDDLVNTYLLGRSAIESWVQDLSFQHSSEGFTEFGLQSQVNQKINTISAIESYLMAYWDPTQDILEENSVVVLARGTLAYFLANEDEKKQIEALFVLLASNIETKIPDPIQRKIFGKTMYGVTDSLAISKWLDEHSTELNAKQSDLDLFNIVWSLLANNIHNKSFIKCNLPESMKDMAISWMEGETFEKLLQNLVDSGAKMIAGSKLRNYKIQHIVDTCENGFAFEGILVLGALIELIPTMLIEDASLLVSKLKDLQKRLKYGLPSEIAIVLYELGYADRVVAIDLSTIFHGTVADKDLVIRVLKAQREAAFAKLNLYPAYFSEVYKNQVAQV